MKNIKFFSFYVLLALSAIAFNSYGQSLASDEGVVINGVKWATCNVDKPGTFADSPEKPGMFYEWNRGVGWTASDPMKNSDGGAVWNSDIPTGLSWEKANDPSPIGWRVPTYEELLKLSDTTKVAFEWINPKIGVTGMKFTDIATGNSIFLRAVGSRDDNIGILDGDDSYGEYWSSTQYDSDNACCLYFIGGSAACRFSFYYNGFSIRPVAE